MTPKSNAFYRIAVRGDNGATWLTGLNKAEISSFFACLVCFIAFFGLLFVIVLIFTLFLRFACAPLREVYGWLPRQRHDKEKHH